MARWRRVADEGRKVVIMDEQSGIKYGREPGGIWHQYGRLSGWHMTRYGSVPPVVRRMMQREAQDG